MEFNKWFKKELKKSPKLRKAMWEGQWDMVFRTAELVLKMRLESSLTMAQLAKKIKTSQPSISRAESQGCSIEFLNRIAKATGNKLDIGFSKSDNLKKS